MKTQEDRITEDEWILRRVHVKEFASFELPKSNHTPLNRR